MLAQPMQIHHLKMSRFQSILLHQELVKLFVFFLLLELLFVLIVHQSSHLSAEIDFEMQLQLA